MKQTPLLLPSRLKLSLLTLSVLSLVFLPLGCGANHSNSADISSSSSGGGNRGRATISVHWSEVSRLIPVASNSLRVEIKDSTGAVVGSQVLARPPQSGTASAVFDPLPVGNLTAQASAFPTSGGTGVAQATATTPLVIQAGQTTAFHLSLGSTIDRVEVTPTTKALLIGQSTTLSAAFKNAAGEQVLTNASTVAWTSDNPAVASVEATGTGGTTGSIQAKAVGTANITVTEQESGKAATVPVTVTSPVPQVVYQNEFNGAIGSEWSKTTATVTPSGGRRFLGEFNKEAVTLSLANLPAHSSITISFKLFVIRSWDGNIVVNAAGNTVGPDIWSLALNGSNLLRTTFGNWEPGSTVDTVLQSYPNTFGAGSFPSRTGASENNTLGFIFSGPRDSVYDLTFTTPHTGSTAAFVFSGQGLTTEGIDEESWGIDSVVVKVTP